MKQQLSVGLIGHQFMGKAHSHAYRDIDMFFPSNRTIKRSVLCGIGDGLEQARIEYGFDSLQTDWRKVVCNPEIDIVDICTPDALHMEIAVEAAKNGKHVFCEKPLSVNAENALQMLNAARGNDVRHMCNFTYRGIPALRLAKELINEGAIGNIYAFHGVYQQDFCLSPETPFMWRMQKSLAGPGIIGDKGAHVIDMARYLCGEFAEVCAQDATFIKQRRNEMGVLCTVETPDMAVFNASFQNGSIGIFEISNASAGHKNSLLIEVNGSKGTLQFDLERLNELRLFEASGNARTRGFKTISVTEKEHPLMAHWWPSGHSIGWEHTFVHQIADFVDAIDNHKDAPSNFEDGWRCQQVVDAVVCSVHEHRFVKLK